MHCQCQWRHVRICGKVTRSAHSPHIIITDVAHCIEHSHNPCVGHAPLLPIPVQNKRVCSGRTPTVVTNRPDIIGGNGTNSQQEDASGAGATHVGTSHDSPAHSVPVLYQSLLYPQAIDEISHRPHVICGKCCHSMQVI